LAILGLAGMAAGVIAGLAHGGDAGPLTAGLLVWPTLAYGSAPVNSLSAQRAALPPELRARRSTEYMRTRTARRVTYTAAGLALAGGAAALALVLLSPGNQQVVPPRIVEPAQGHNVVYHKQRPTEPPSTPAPPGTSGPGSPSPTPSTSSTPPSSGPSSPAPTTGSTPTSTTPTPTSTTPTTPSSTTTSTPSSSP
jgi:hypothetical protein